MPSWRQKHIWNGRPCSPANAAIATHCTARHRTAQALPARRSSSAPTRCATGRRRRAQPPIRPPERCAAPATPSVIRRAMRWVTGRAAHKARPAAGRRRQPGPGAVAAGRREGPHRHPARRQLLRPGRRAGLRDERGPDQQGREADPVVGQCRLLRQCLGRCTVTGCPTTGSPVRRVSGPADFLWTGGLWSRLKSPSTFPIMASAGPGPSGDPSMDRDVGPHRGGSMQVGFP